ncbi:HNH endonuclease [Pseudomonas sp. A-RE-26]|uniref:HNH endonuclease n=1 Tax=Pseudomonas sp. A-RE-26 TaxID=2832402 RepID=UPI001CC1341A|nr:HNH endonuclease [Pseudomonas sp. A-RE-26]
MSHGPTYIASKGYCIYCKRSEVRLTDEHIFPYFLGGAHVIKNASCDDCARITSKFEMDVARELWGDARASYNAPTRKKKNRKKHIIQPDFYNPGQTILVPIEEFPAAMVFYQMPKAGILQGLPDSVDLSTQWTPVAIHDTDKDNKFKEKYGKFATSRFRHVPDSFARLLVKIAYGQVLFSLDPDDFRPFCLPYILEPKKNLSYIVGGRSSSPEPKEGIGYEIKTNCIKFPKRLLIIVEIQLLSNASTPSYHVFVGDVVGESEIKRAYDKIEATWAVEVDYDHCYKAVSDDAFHWMPSHWPLPAWGTD